VWHLYAGAPLALSVSPDGETVTTTVLGADLEAGQRPQAVVPAGVWQSAVPLGSWALAGCTVSPAFDFDGFELAPPDWVPRAANTPDQAADGLTSNQ
jgi:hypothetical protein